MKMRHHMSTAKGLRQHQLSLAEAKKEISHGMREAECSSYEQRVAAVTQRAHELCREFGRLDLDVAIDSISMAPVRTAHTVKLVRNNSEQAVVLSKEEFLNEFDLFERAAVPKLRAAIESFPGK